MACYNQPFYHTILRLVCFFVLILFFVFCLFVSVLNLSERYITLPLWNVGSERDEQPLVRTILTIEKRKKEIRRATTDAAEVQAMDKTGTLRARSVTEIETNRSLNIQINHARMQFTSCDENNSAINCQLAAFRSLLKSTLKKKITCENRSIIFFF